MSDIKRMEQKGGGWYNAASVAGRLSAAAYQGQHRDRSMKTRRFATKQEKAMLWAMQDGRCAICHRLLPERFDADHIVAVCNSGPKTFWNLQGVCVPCHQKKTRQDLCRESASSN